MKDLATASRESGILAGTWLPGCVVMRLASTAPELIVAVALHRETLTPALVAFDLAVGAFRAVAAEEIPSAPPAGALRLPCNDELGEFRRALLPLALNHRNGGV